MMEGTAANERGVEKAVDEGPEEAVNANQSQHHALSRETTAVSAFHLLGKLKAAINEVVMSLENSASALSVDDCIAVTEEGLRALKTIKVDRRIEYRRHLNLNSTRANGPSPMNRETDDSEPFDGVLSADPVAMLNARSMLHSPKSKKVSPKRIQSDSQRRDDIEAARHASALRSEERQRKAEEKRLEKLSEMKTKLVAAGERSQLAKQRRTQAEERLRSDTMERQENGARRLEEVLEQTKERARRGHSRVEEVRFNYALRQQTKALLLDRKMSEAEHNQEAKREEIQRIAQERNEAMLAAAERRRNLSQERIEKQQQREQQRRENLRRLEEQKRAEKDIKEQKAEELEKRLQQRQREVNAEAEARNRKAEERIQQSAQLREEQREKLRVKMGKQDQKLKEVRQRRERDCDTKPTVQELMPVIAPQEEEQQAQRMAKVVAASARQGKAFLENYQKECALSAKDVNRSKLRSILTRLSSNTALVQCRQTLHDLLGSGDLADVDHEYVRYYNAYETFIRVMTDARRAGDVATFRLAANALLRFITDTLEGRQHGLVFVRAGNVAPLLICIREEIKGLKRQSHSVPLGAALEILQLCLDRIVTDAQSIARLIPVRDQLMADLDAASIEKYCIAVTRVCTEEEDLEVVYSAVRLLYVQINVLSKRKGDCPVVWFRQVACAFFSLLQNILTPDDNSEVSPPLSARQMTIVFIVFRVLNSLARWHLEILQELLHDTSSERGSSVGGTASQHVDPTRGSGFPDKSSVSASAGVITRMELFHVLSGFFAYAQTHPELLETIPSEKPTAAANGDAAGSVRASFDDALLFGITLSQVPSFPSGENIPVSEVVAASSLHLRAALHECLLLIGYLCIQDKQLQSMFAWGKGKSLVSRLLSAMPFQYFTSARHILFPTLLAIMVDAEANLSLAGSEMDMGQLLKFIEEEYQALPKKAKLYALQRHAELHPPAKEKPIDLQPVRWVDLLGGDDDEFLLEQRRMSQTAPTAPVTQQGHPFVMVEKERIYRLHKNTVVTPSGCFKIERRFPLALWPAVIEQLTKAVGKPADSQPASCDSNVE